MPYQFILRQFSYLLPFRHKMDANLKFKSEMVLNGVFLSIFAIEAKRIN